MKKGSVFLIPTYLSEKNDKTFLAPMVLDVIKNTDYFLVENVRTARRYISSLKLGLIIEELNFDILDKKSRAQEVSEKMSILKSGKNIGIISEAGVPGLADPGHLAVRFAHEHNIRVIPLPGASSIQTAVTSSGFSGQQFTFHGYLPIQKSDRVKAINGIGAELEQSGYTQVFMETPFRNMSLLSDLIGNLKPKTLLHIASDIFGEKEYLKTKPISVWAKEKLDLHKVPTVFCLGQAR